MRWSRLILISPGFGVSTSVPTNACIVDKANPALTGRTSLPVSLSSKEVKGESRAQATPVAELIVRQRRR